jgi:hypothetical protein
MALLFLKQPAPAKYGFFTIKPMACNVKLHGSEEWSGNRPIGQLDTTKHSGNTIVVFCIERAGRSQRRRQYARLLRRKRTEAANVSQLGSSPARRVIAASEFWKVANARCFCNSVETPTAIDDLASAFCSSHRVLKFSAASPPGSRLFSTIAH